MPIKLLIADDHEVVRAGIAQWLASASDIELSAQAADGDEAVAKAEAVQPDVALLDVRMPKSDGIACLGRLQTASPRTATLMFSAYDNPTYIARCVALGARGYLLKSATSEEVLSSIRKAAAGESLWSREGLRQVTGALSTPRLEVELEAPLTKRESEVLKQIALGLSNKEIAQSLEISYETVKEHVQHILRKVGVADRTQAAVWAVRRGLA